MNINQTLLDQVCRIAHEAGQATLPIYRSDFEVQDKTDNSPLTQADLIAHRLIAQGLTELTPELPQLSEEGADIDYQTRSQWHEYWLIDPLDGTREFINQNDQFTINIALIRAHQPVLGVVYAPALGQLWCGADSLGAFHRKGDADNTRIQVDAYQQDKPRVLVSRSHRSEGIEQLLTNMRQYEPVSMGSSLKFCLIAEGNADFYPRLGPTSEWDTAAGHAVLKAAGGRVTELDGQELSYNETDSYLNEPFLAFGDARHDWFGYLPGQQQKTHHSE